MTETSHPFREREPMREQNQRVGGFAVREVEPVRSRRASTVHAVAVPR